MKEQTQLPITKVFCDACGYQWIPRVPEPAKCPKCQARGTVLIAKEPRKEKAQ